MELTDQDVKRLVRRVMHKQDPRLLLDAIRMLVANRVTLSRELRRTQALLDQYRRAMSQHHDELRKNPARRLIERLLFGYEPDPTRTLQLDASRLARHNLELKARLSRMDQELQAYRGIRGRQQALTERLKATQNALKAYERQVTELTDALKGTVSADEIQTKIRHETRMIRRLLSEARQNAHNAEQVAQSLRVELQTTQKRLVEAQKQIADLNAERETLLQQNEYPTHQVNDLQTETEQLRTERDRSTLAREQAMAELDRTRYEKDALEMRLRETEGEIAVLRQHRQQLIRAIEENVKEKRRIRAHLREALEELHELRRIKTRAPVVATIHPRDSRPTPEPDRNATATLPRPMQAIQP